MQSDRRDFLKTTGKAAAAGAATLALGGRVLGANDRVRIAIVGTRGRGKDHINGFRKLPNVEIAALCDADENILNQRLSDIEGFGLPRPKGYWDIRKLLEDKDIDAITIAAPNHWHSLMTIWGCQAGKDVYVEKPLSHNWFEGRQAVRAMQKYKRIVQHGSQSRSNPGMIEAIKHVHEGTIGEVYMARALCYKWRATIGKATPEPIPAGVHYDLWTGPAPMKPFTKNRFHYNWHWIWDTGDGEVGNQAIHEIDIARWGLQVKFPTQVSALGGHFVFDDDQETPNVVNASFTFAGANGKHKMVELAVRHWITNHEGEIGSGAFKSAAIPPAGLTAPGTQAPAPGKARASGPGAAPLGAVDAKTNTIGNLFYGSDGYLAIDGYDAYKSWLKKDVEPGPEGRGAADHWANFIDCVRSRKAEDIHSPVEEAHMSCTMMHLANVSYRLGRTLNFDPAKGQVIGDDEANRLLRGSYRAPYVVPEQV